MEVTGPCPLPMPACPRWQPRQSGAAGSAAGLLFPKLKGLVIPDRIKGGKVRSESSRETSITGDEAARVARRAGAGRPQDAPVSPPGQTEAQHALRMAPPQHQPYQPLELIGLNQDAHTTSCPSYSRQPAPLPWAASRAPQSSEPHVLLAPAGRHAPLASLPTAGWTFGTPDGASCVGVRKASSLVCFSSSCDPARQTAARIARNTGSPRPGCVPWGNPPFGSGTQFPCLDNRRHAPYRVPQGPRLPGRPGLGCALVPGWHRAHLV